MDLNADLGESFGRWTLGDDEAMLGVVTSANVACGFHAGDPLTLSRTCTAAVDAGVAIGAQVGYRDLAGFGRRFIDIAPDDLVADLQYQLGALDGLARIAGDRVLYVKPHGALYNTIVHHEEQAAAVVRAVAEYNDKLPVLGLPGSAFLARAAEAGLNGVPEAFADRAYNADGTLVPRRLDGAVLHDEDQIADRVMAMATKGTIVAIDGTEIAVEARSICVHGDTPGAVGIAHAVRKALTSAGVAIEAFAV